MTKKTKTIGIDARFYSTKAGLGRYTRNLIHELEKIDKKNAYKIFLSKKDFKRCRLKNKNFIKIKADIPWYSVKEQVILPFILLREKVNLMHFPHFNVPILYRKPYVVTIHDLIMDFFPTKRATTRASWISKIIRFGYKKVINSGIKRAKKIIAVSNYTKSCIENFYNIDPKKVIRIYEGVDNKLNKKRDKTQSPNTKNPKPYLLYVGSAYPHKNLENLIKSYKIFRRSKFGKKHKLILVGEKDYFYKRLENWSKRRGYNRGVSFMGAVSDKKLSELYQNASLFVFPSLMEGFGLPPLEALANGLPVVSSYYPPMPEILAKNAIYFDPADPSDISEKLWEALKEERTVSREFLNKYCWRKMAESIKKIYLQ